MSALSKILRDAEGGLMLFMCPGCNQAHGIRVAGDKPIWKWSGDVVRPTFSPSVLVSYYQITPEGCAMIARGDAPPDGERYPGKDVVCHSFVKDGRIEYLGDCTHSLGGKTSDLPAWTEIGT